MWPAIHQRRSSMAVTVHFMFAYVAIVSVETKTDIMTPFGEKLRAYRAKKGISQAELARAVGVSPAYLSALEHGQRGKPSWALVQDIIQYFEIIWDEAEELESLARITHPPVAGDTAGMNAKATELANRLARDAGQLSEDQLDQMLDTSKKK